MDESSQQPAGGSTGVVTGVAAPPPGRASLDRRQLVAALAAGAIAAVAVPGFAPGLGVTLSGLALAVAALAGRGWTDGVTAQRTDAKSAGGPGAPAVTAPSAPRRGSIDLWRWAAGLVAVAGVLLPSVSDAGWTITLALLASLGMAVYATGGGRAWAGVIMPPLRAVLVTVEAAVATVEGIVAFTPRRANAAPMVRAALLTLVLVTMFGALFVSADEVFGRLVDRYLVPDIDLALVPARLVMFVFAAVVAVLLVLLRPVARDDRLPAPPRRYLRGVEWQVPLTGLVLLFAAFVAVQFQVLFGGHQRVLETVGLTYAEYVHQGFGQLMVVAALTLAVVAAAARYARPLSPGERRRRTVLLGALCVLTLVVLASAMHRLVVYEEAYGFTRLRLSAQAIIVWLAAVFAVVAVAGALRRARALPRALVLLTGAALVAFGYLQPDAVIARGNVERFEATGVIDVHYQIGLSADAVPAFERLPADLRACVSARHAWRLEDGGRFRGWGALNFSRARASTLLDDLQADPGACPAALRERLARDQNYYREVGAGS